MDGERPALNVVKRELEQQVDRWSWSIAEILAAPHEALLYIRRLELESELLTKQLAKKP